MVLAVVDVAVTASVEAVLEGTGSVDTEGTGSVDTAGTASVDTAGTASVDTAGTASVDTEGTASVDTAAARTASAAGSLVVGATSCPGCSACGTASGFDGTASLGAGSAGLRASLGEGADANKDEKKPTLATGLAGGAVACSVALLTLASGLAGAAAAACSVTFAGVA